MNDNKLTRILNRAADCIEAACYTEGFPVRIGVNDIVVLANQCRMYARPLLNRSDVFAWQTEHLGNEQPGYEFGSAFRGIQAIKQKAYPVIKGQLGLPSESAFSIEIGGGAILFDFSVVDLAGEEYFHPLPAQDLPASRKNQIVVGKTLDSETVIINFENVPHHHILIVGSTGSGKTVLINTLIGGIASSYAPTEVCFFMASGKEEDVTPWVDLPHLLYPPSYDIREIMAMLSWVRKERERRSHLAAKDKAGLPHIVVVIGELGALLSKPNATEMSNLLDDILSLGRSSNIHLFASTQRPTSRKVGGVDAKAQYKLIVCGSMSNPQEAYIALGMGGSGAEFLPDRGAFVTNHGVRFQAAYLGDDIDPEGITNIIATAKGKYGEANYIELDITPLGSVESSRLTEDILRVIEKIEETEVTEITKSWISTMLSWGYSRANRVWLELNRVGVLKPRESDNTGAELDMEKLKSEYGRS